MAETDNEQLKVNINGGIFPIWWLRKKSAITTDLLSDKVVTTEKLADKSVTEDKLGDGAVTEAKLTTALKNKIDGKVDKVTGKSLIDAGVASAMRWVDDETVEITGNIAPDDVNASGEVKDGNGNKLSDMAKNTYVNTELAKKMSKADYKVLQFNGFVDNVTIEGSSVGTVSVSNIKYDKTRKCFVALDNGKYYTSWGTPASSDYNVYDGGWKTANNAFINIGVSGDIEVAMFGGYVDNVTVETYSSPFPLTPEAKDIFWDTTHKKFVVKVVTGTAPLQTTHYYDDWATKSLYHNADGSVTNNAFLDISTKDINNKVDKVAGKSLIDSGVAEAFGENADYGFSFDDGMKFNGQVEVQDANGNAYNVGNTLASKAEKSIVNELVAEVFPLTVSYTDHNAGTYEDGTSVTPEATASITRKGVDISGDDGTTFVIPDGATLGADKKTWSAPAISTGTVNYSASVQQGGQTKNLPTLTYRFMNYRYRGEVSAIPTDYATAIKALATKELSTTPTLGGTNLSANKYYLFAVKGSATLVCRENSTNARVSGCVTGTVTIKQENYDLTGKSNLYSYILVPKSGSMWTIKITNA